MTHAEVEAYILSMPNSFLDYPFGEGVAVYKVGEKEQSDESREQRAESKVAEGKMFALIAEGKSPINLSLKCDPQLALVLREKYETVMPGYHLNKKHWNTLVLSGQLPWEEVRSLIQHSYALVTQK
jgi:predicted DNA-binding protein (MmcQ/YjbR family)